MAYGTVKVDTIIFTNEGIDQTITVSGIVQSISGNSTATGTIQGATIIGTSTVSGATVTGNTVNAQIIYAGSGVFGSGIFASGLIASYKVNATTGVFQDVSLLSLSGTYITGDTGIYTTQLSGATITGGIGQYTSLTGVSGVYTTQLSGATITGNIGSFTTVTGGVATITSGVFALGEEALPSISFSSDPNTGIYSPGADQLALSTSGTGRLFVNADGTVIAGVNNKADINDGAGTSFTPSLFATATSGSAGVGAYVFDGTNNRRAGLFVDQTNAIWGLSSKWSTGQPDFVIRSGASERARIDSSGRLLVGTSTSVTSDRSITPQIQLAGTSQSASAVSLTNYNSGGNPSHLILGSSKGGDVATQGLVASGGSLGVIAFTGSDGTAPIDAVFISAEVDGDPAYASDNLQATKTYRIVTVTSSDWSAIGGPNPASVGDVFTATGGAAGLGTAILNAGNMPGRLVFSTTADGANSPTERMRIGSDGSVGIGTSSPDELLHIEGDTAEFKGTNTNQIADTAGTEQVFKFGIEAQKNSVYGPAGSIIFRQDGSTWSSVDQYNKPTRLEFCTQDSSSLDNSETPRLVIDKDGQVGIGITSPLGTTHIRTASTGLAAVNAAGNELVIENSTTAGMTILAGNTSTANIYFADSDNAQPGGINYDHNDNSLGFRVNADERARIDSSGRLLVGISNARSNFFSGANNSQFQVEGTNTDTSAAAIVRNSANASSPVLYLAKTRGSATGSNTSVLNNDQIGSIWFQGADGTNLVPCALIQAQVDGTPAYAATALVNGQTYRIVTVGTTDFTLIGASANTVGTVFTATGPGTGTGTAILNAGNMPGRLVFSTTADGANSPTERMRIGSDGSVGIGTSSPNVPLSVIGTTSQTYTNNPYNVEISDDRAYAAGVGGGISFRAKYNAAGAYSNIGFISGIKENGTDGNYAGALVLGTRTAGSGGGSMERLRISSTGNVGIGTQSANYQLELSTDSAGKPSTNTWTIVSDERIKEEIELADLDLCYEAVKNIPLKRFKWKDEVYTEEQAYDRRKLGWIAQDVEAVFPKAVRQHEFKYNQVFEEVVIPAVPAELDDDGNVITEEQPERIEKGELISEEVIEDCRDLNSDQLYAAMYGAIQKLISKVETLEAEVAALKG